MSPLGGDFLLQPCSRKCDQFGIGSPPVVGICGAIFLYIMKGLLEMSGKKLPFTCSGSILFFLSKVRSQN